MTQSKNYPVTNQVIVPQPHLTELPKEKCCHCSGWIPFVTAGILSILFMVGIYRFGGSKIFPQPIDIYADMIPIVKKGYLQVIPFPLDSNDTRQREFYVQLPLKKAGQTKFVGSLDQLFKGYPEKHEHPYINCWLENPTKDHPCFFDSSWLVDTCSKNNSYGYDINKGEYSPCFVLKFQDTEDWMPLTPDYTAILHSKVGFDTSQIDQGFIPVFCVAKHRGRRSTSVDVEVYPPKGYSIHYFPQNNFNTSSYLSPLVAVKVKGIRRNVNVTVVCSIISPNTYGLWNSGQISVSFSSL